LNYVPLISNI